MRNRSADEAQNRQPPQATESVWDYPRPPRLEPTSQHVRVVHAGTVIAETSSALRVLETSHPPVFYIAPEHVRTDLLRPSSHRRSFCEYKGVAEYWDLALPAAGDASPAASSTSAPTLVHAVAWSYAAPAPGFEELRGYLAFYAGRVDECTVDGERVEAQRGSFYGGWITSGVRGPFKG